LKKKKVMKADQYELARVLNYCGQWREAEEQFSKAMQIKKEIGHTQSQGVIWAYRALAALLRGQADEALAAAQEALRLADEDTRTRYPHERDYVDCYWLLGWAFLAQGQLEAAQTHLDEALRRCRAINLVELEPSILLAQARLALARKDPAQAKTLAQEARLIAERAGYVLNLAEIHNLLAQLALAEGDQAVARDHAQQAKDYALCDGPPYSYKVAYDEAERLLQAALGG
jgi:tetratricopeptide (TPR) repeat protein